MEGLPPAKDILSRQKIARLRTLICVTQQGEWWVFALRPGHGEGSSQPYEKVPNRKKSFPAAQTKWPPAFWSSEVELFRATSQIETLVSKHTHSREKKPLAFMAAENPESSRGEQQSMLLGTLRSKQETGDHPSLRIF